MKNQKVNIMAKRAEKLYNSKIHKDFDNQLMLFSPNDLEVVGATLVYASKKKVVEIEIDNLVPLSNDNLNI